MNPIIYRLAADAVLVIHGGFVAFVIVGLLITLVGGLLEWRWVRNPWLRLLHLIAIGIVVVQAWLGIVCPLTTLENWLRAQASQTSYPGGFIAFWLRSLLFYRAQPWVFTAIYSGFGALVVASFYFVRPNRFRRSA